MTTLSNMERFLGAGIIVVALLAVMYHCTPQLLHWTMFQREVTPWFGL